MKQYLNVFTFQALLVLIILLENILNKNNNVLRKLLFYEFTYKPQLIIFNKKGKVIIITGGYGVL